MAATRGSGAGDPGARPSIKEPRQEGHALLPHCPARFVPSLSSIMATILNSSRRCPLFLVASRPEGFTALHVLISFRQMSYSCFPGTFKAALSPNQKPKRMLKTAIKGVKILSHHAACAMDGQPMGNTTKKIKASVKP